MMQFFFRQIFVKTFQVEQPLSPQLDRRDIRFSAFKKPVETSLVHSQIIRRFLQGKELVFFIFHVTFPFLL
jgi:hypothetical protein